MWLFVKGVFVWTRERASSAMVDDDAKILLFNWHDNCILLQNYSSFNWVIIYILIKISKIDRYLTVWKITEKDIHFLSIFNCTFFHSRKFFTLFWNCEDEVKNHAKMGTGCWMGSFHINWLDTWGFIYCAISIFEYGIVFRKM